MTNRSVFEALIVSAKKQGYDIIDAHWVDGYFVFETEKDTIVHFKVKQCKKWLFGMWFTNGDEKDKRAFIVFGQPENNIDKFKPTCSYFSYTSTADLTADEKGVEYNLNDACDKVFGPIRYDRNLAWTLHDGNFYPKNKLQAKWQLFSYQMYQLYQNFIGDVGIRNLEYGVVSYSGIFGKKYPFKGLVLFFKYLFNKKAKPDWNKV